MAHRAMALLGCVCLVLAVWAATTSPSVGAGQSPTNLEGSVFRVGNTIPSDPGAVVPASADVPAGER